MLLSIKNRGFKTSSLSLGVIFLLQSLNLPSVFAVGGPNQPETSSFTPAGDLEMVDLFTGDFKYNIPLLEVGGYPINLSYNSDVGPDSESGWVGLGWSLNPGSIARSMRGIPDDFNGDVVKTKTEKKDDWTVGSGVSADVELAGFTLNNYTKIGLTVGVGVKYNNYNGVGLDFTLNPSIGISDHNAFGLNAGIGLSVSTDEGVTISPQVSLDAKMEKDAVQNGVRSYHGGGISSSIGTSYNSRSGLQDVTLGFNPYFTKGRTVTTPGGIDPTKSYKDVIGGPSAAMTLGTFASPSYTPTLGNSYSNNSFSTSYKAGFTAFAIFGNATFSLYMSHVGIDSDEKSTPSYGYLYEHNYTEGGQYDFNRDNDGIITHNTPNLAIPYHTYDIYSVTGQGVGGTYRPHRTDIGIVHDATVTNKSRGLDLAGIEVGVGNLVKIGGNPKFNSSNSESGVWDDDKNKVKDDFQFKEPAVNSLTQRVYFKSIAEPTVFKNEEVFASLGEFDAVKFDLNKEERSVNSQLITNDGAVSGTSYERTEREIQNQYFDFRVSGDETTSFFNYDIDVYNPISEDGNQTTTQLDRNQYGTGSHVSEVSILRNDGVKFVYGIPAYNTYQISVSESSSQEDRDEDNVGPMGKRAFDDYKQTTVLPPYVHSHLLTAVVSPDYVDRGKPGPDEFDLGNYTVFNYTKAVEDFGWRNPMQDGVGLLNKGLNGVEDDDDRINYTFGKKDLWYVHSIESRTHIAIFHIEDRIDGVGFKNERGELDTSKRQKLLRSISLYTKSEYYKEEGSPIALKEIHFNYDYSLCGGMKLRTHDGTGLNTDYNGVKGKLTLTDVYFTYQNSDKGSNDEYHFNYDNINPSYEINKTDRWGCYRNDANGLLGQPGLDNETFPYVVQDKQKRDEEVAAWSLSSIELPSGGRIDVTYESDDYAFVQQKRAMQMMQVVAINDATSHTNVFGNINNNTFLNVHIRLPQEVANKEQFLRDYLLDEYGAPIEQVFFKMKMKMGAAEDYVPGFVNVNLLDGDNYGVSPDGQYGYIRIEDDKSSNVYQPFVKTGAQFAQLRMHKQLTQPPEGAPNPANIDGIIGLFAQVGEAFADLFQGPIGAALSEGYGEEVRLYESFIRLYNPTRAKLGGTHRVKRITMTDNWESLTENQNDFSHVYGKEYDYTIYDEGLQRSISSGVATYEPILGGDENPWKKADVYDIQKTWAPDEANYQMTPYGETAFPSPQIGYRQVLVKDFDPTEPGGSNTISVKTGHTVHKFYTAKEFPTTVRKTDLDPAIKNPGITFGLFTHNSAGYYASQGFVIELNDMHGKQRTTEVYEEGAEEPITSIEYIYHTKQGEAGRPTELTVDNSIPVLGAGGKIENKLYGVDYDFVIDTRKATTKATTVGADVNLEIFLLGIFPAATGSVFPSEKISETELKTIVTNKVINRKGILHKTITKDKGSIYEKEHLLYDGKTGNLLLTSMTDHFRRPIYSFTYPAYWGHERMGPASENLGLVESGSISTLSTNHHRIGDVLSLVEADGTSRLGWVTSVSPTVKVVDINNKDITGSFESIRVIQSGNKNMLSATMGGVSSLESPISENDELILQTNHENTLFNNSVLSSSATVYGNDWQVYCTSSKYNPSYNEFYKGRAGNFRPLTQYAFLTKRTQSSDIDIRQDGTLEDFVPYWKYYGGNDGGAWNSFYHPLWVPANVITVFNGRGQELEEVDRLNRFSSALYSFKSNLPSAIVQNSRYQEMGFDSFEDYEYDRTYTRHFGSNSWRTQITTSHSHSGKHSVRIPSNSSIKMRKTFRSCFTDPDIPNRKSITVPEIIR